MAAKLTDLGRLRKALRQQQGATEDGILHFHNDYKGNFYYFDAFLFRNHFRKEDILFSNIYEELFHNAHNWKFIRRCAIEEFFDNSFDAAIKYLVDEYEKRNGKII